MSSFKFIDLIKHGLIYGVGGIAQSALGFILLPILTAKMSLENFGAYSLILMSATIASAIFYLGMTSAMPRSYFDFSEEVQRKTIFTTAFVILIVGAIGQISVGYWCAEIIANLVFQSMNAQYIDAIRWAFLGGALSFINQYFFSYLRLKRYSLSAVFFSISGVIVGVSLTIWLLKAQDEILIAPFKAVSFAQILILVGILMLYGKEMFVKRFSLGGCKPLLHFGLATIFTSFSVMALDWADRIIIERFMSLSDVGLYSAANRVSGLIGVLLIAPFTQIWSPMMYEYQMNYDIKKITAKVLSYFLMASAIVLTFMALFSVSILNFLIKFEITQTLIFLFLVFSLSNILNGTANIVVAGIFYERKVYLMPFIYAAIAAIKIILNINLIPAYGIGAAAFNALIGSILIPCSIYFFSKKYFYFPIEWSRLIRLAVVVSMLLVFCATLQPENNLIIYFIGHFILWILTLFVIYKICIFPDEKVYLENKVKIIYMSFVKKFRLRT